MKKNILITGAIHPKALSDLKKIDSYNVNYKPDISDIHKIVADIDILVTRSETKIDKFLIDKAIKLKMIARAAVGVSNIDIEYCTKKGILVINCPGKNTNSAAELTMGLLISMLRNIPQAYNSLKNGIWDRHKFSGTEIRHKKIGIIGLGNVGHRFAMMLEGFEIDLYAYDPYISTNVFEKYNAKACKSLLEIAKKVDILSCHVPLNKETKGMVNLDILKAMKKGSYILNCARGGIVVEKDLLNALESGHISAAGIDTWENEPNPNKNLLLHKNVFSTQHIGASTNEAQLAIGHTIVSEINNWNFGNVVNYPVNLPKISVMKQDLLKSYTVLSEKLAVFIAQMIDFHIDEIDFYYRGDLAKQDPSFLKLAFMKGFLGKRVNDHVSYVNSEKLFEKLGIKFNCYPDPNFSSYKSAIKIILNASNKKLIIGGIVFDEKYNRLSLINNYRFEISPKGNILVVENYDIPGIVGKIGSYLGSKNINIDSFDLSRNKMGGQAMALIKLDSPLNNTHLKEISEMKDIIKVRQIQI